MSTRIAEVHFPFGEDLDECLFDPREAYPWVALADEWVMALEEQPHAVVTEWDSSDTVVSDPGGENEADEYVFFLRGGSDEDKLRTARQLAALEGMPGNAYVILTDDDSDEGVGTRVDLSTPAQ